MAHGPKRVTSASCLILKVLLFSTLISCWFLKNQIEFPISGFSQRSQRRETTEHRGGKAGLPGPPGLLRSGGGGHSRSHPRPGAALRSASCPHTSHTCSFSLPKLASSHSPVRSCPLPQAPAAQTQATHSPLALTPRTGWPTSLILTAANGQTPNPSKAFLLPFPGLGHVAFWSQSRTYLPAGKSPWVRLSRP